jgi:hypothetical protein
MMLDERYILHRFKATRLSAVVGSVMLGVFFIYEFVANRIYRWDLLSVMVVMAVTKVVALSILRRTN